MTQSPPAALQTAPADRPTTVRWPPARTAPDGAWARPGTLVAMARGLRGHCPCCGEGRLFQGWLQQIPVCSACRAPVGAARGEDVPPYFVIFIVAHLVIAMQVMTDSWLNLSLIAEASIFLPLTLALCLALLRPVKGATIGLMMQLGLVQPAAAAV